MRKKVCSLIVQFSFLPQVIWAALLHRKLAANSYVLTNGTLQIVLIVIFAEITALSVLCSIRRFYVTRFLLIGAYIQLIASMYFFGLRFERFAALNNETYYFIMFGAIMTAINAIALYNYKYVGEGLGARPQKGSIYDE
ncbi:MAG: hypothetical protein LBC86_09965 [Oscillospiraceae bacterium]|jgi:hypothetical protein|nr:hypothetical protein [Oscillospiraceae bacterium]